MEWETIDADQVKDIMSDLAPRPPKHLTETPEAAEPPADAPTPNVVPTPAFVEPVKEVSAPNVAPARESTPQEKPPLF